MDRVLRDWRTAPVGGRVRAMLAFLEKLTLEPATVTTADAAALREAGVSDAAAADAIHVAALFNIYDRMADTFGFDIPGPEGFAQSARMLLRRGYL